MGRLTMAPIRMGEELTVPKGVTVYWNMHHVNESPEFHQGTNTTEFDGFRYSRLREEQGLSNKSLLAMTGVDHLLFGHGLDSCPGRFFATAVIKVFFIHLLQNFDVRFAQECRPLHHYVGLAGVLDRQAKILIRRRS